MGKSINSIKKVFANLRKNAYYKAQREMTKGLPAAVEILHSFVRQAMDRANIGSMTGNTLNSFGIGLYRDGKFISCATTSGVEGRSPIHVTLKEGDVYPAGSPRYDGGVQGGAFRADEGERNFMANEMVVNYLRRYAPTRKAPSLSYRCACYLEYNKGVARESLMLFADYVESRGGDIREFRFD